MKYIVAHIDDCEFVILAESGSLEQAKRYCDEYTSGEEQYNSSDTPGHNNHYHLEVYRDKVVDEDGSAINEIYRTNEFYKRF